MEKLISEMQEYAKENHIPIMDIEGLEFMRDYIKNNHVEKILELGSAIGYSAIQMARINENIKVVTVERDVERYNKALENIEKAQLTNQIEIHLIDALEFVSDEQFDLIFIDAAKAQYIKFFERYEKNLKDNGVIISDNLDFHGLVNHHEKIINRNTKQLVRKIEKYIEYLKNNKNYDTEFIRKGDGIALTRKNCYNSREI